MANDRLSPFVPFENKPANHEDQLTRALLIVLRLCPMAHVTWLRLVDPARELGSLPPATFDTQRREIPVAEDPEEVELISVFLTPERPETQGVVEESDRRQVLDAIIDYEGQPVVVVENKIVVDSDFQALNVNTGQRIKTGLGKEAVVVRWRDLIEQLMNLIEKDLVGGGESVLLQDFLTYVEDHFEDLGPFRVLSLCKGNPRRVTRRLRSILQEASGFEATIDQHGPTAAFDSGASTRVADRAYLRYLENHPAGTVISLSVYPADTLTQAREFYSNLQVVEQVRELARGPDWLLRPNYHFGHMQPGLCWTKSTITTNDYLNYWTDRIANTGIVPRDRWVEFWKELTKTGIASDSDWPEFERRFVNSGIQAATPRPGLMLERIWQLSAAERLDSKGALIPEVRSALTEIESALSGS